MQESALPRDVYAPAPKLSISWVAESGSETPAAAAMIRGMANDSLVDRARGLWRELAREPVAFDAGAANIVVSPGSLLCPRGWIGIVLLGDAAIVSAPDDARAEAARAAFARLPLADLADPERLAAHLPLAEVLGPAALAYVSADEFRPAEAAATDHVRVRARVRARIEQLPVGHADLVALERAAGEEDANEVGLDEITSPAFVIRAVDDGSVVAACGYRLWPRNTAHISVLTHPAWRGLGLAKATGGAATRHALDAGLLPQWRARVPASRRAAAALGYREIGRQLSFRV